MLDVGCSPAAILMLATSLAAQATDPIVRAGFGDGWETRWEEVQLDQRVNRFEPIREDGRPVLRVESDGSASALSYMLELAPETVGAISWSWKVESAIGHDRSEREKAGDDYAARFFVIFDDEPFSRGARAICYVWAGAEPVRATFRNPYISEVATIVLQSGDDRAGVWITEERDVLADYVAAFDERPERITGVAVMVDTDDTGTHATAWFGEVRVWPREAADGN
ncbi:MAG: DUF3047 domain-containing protein [Gemmatimonadetes bacterium]|uniref:DUF3047 domain-containing protein n=1 Tax=Candidatus Kutchimonas denitrificans TaxID=3056748 RepID=A0AAE4ZC49_9BACT|nr:DUF3047 domain-containing protein [Gemmatimonadota bacterium]NIR74815.1 DUF3047 domain-containing protein [Candidatus Kutchimonas denitrificans]NIR99926.1 DUF3047 domain-containing protein [Gemmatimonadota bacterium]NIT65510.1 DUF3047 domain-containing protein [Gemmatimonadota bacterium]NIU52480.1 DUF3047 domain-containing protein [Gemmatimonadota bacterium]